MPSDAGVDHRVDDRNLTGVFGLGRRALPHYLDVGFEAAGNSPGVDALPENESCRLGNDADTSPLRALTTADRGEALRKR